jgi:cbb3-type cytochrome oxidase subunit 3
MPYETIRTLAGTIGLLIFVALFCAVLIYVFWPGNKASFERARRLPLENDEGEAKRSENNGR